MTTKVAPAKKSRRASRKKSTIKNSSKKKEAKIDLSKSYNEYKNFEGQQYTGMKVGRSHK